MWWKQHLSYRLCLSLPFLASLALFKELGLPRSLHMLQPCSPVILLSLWPKHPHSVVSQQICVSVAEVLFYFVRAVYFIPIRFLGLWDLFLYLFIFLFFCFYINNINSESLTLWDISLILSNEHL